MAETVRIATYNTELSRDGPGLLLRDIRRGKDEQILAVLQVIATVSPDILHLIGVDFDLDGHALGAFADRLSEVGVDYPHRFAVRPNTGMQTGLDLDGDGRLGGPRDAQGFGRFSGEGGMAILSRLPILDEQARDFSGYLWKDLPGGIPPMLNGAPFPSREAFEIQRLSSKAHWQVPVAMPDGQVLHLLAFHANTPVFDGEEDRNGRRNHDELAFWRLFLDGSLPLQPPIGPVVVIGDANLDPVDGDGRREAITALLGHERLTDSRPRSSGGAHAANPDHKGDPALDTADWTDPLPGNLRVDYVLPSRDLSVIGSGVFWPGPGEPLHDTATQASRHKMVWVDLAF